MSRRCPECLRANEDSRTFCTHCGATLDPHLRLIQDLERQTETASQKQAEARKEDMSFYVNRAPAGEQAPPHPRAPPRPGRGGGGLVF